MPHFIPKNVSISSIYKVKELAKRDTYTCFGQPQLGKPRLEFHINIGAGAMTQQI